MGDKKESLNSLQQVKYTIITKTSKDFKAGTTDSEVFIQIIGNDCKSTTPWVILDNFFRDDFELGRTDKFTIKTTDVGSPDAIRLKLNKQKDKFGWLCETVTVSREGSPAVFFSVYDWIYEEATICAGQATLPQHETKPLIRDIRRVEIEKHKYVYQWHLLPTEDQPGWSLPRYAWADKYTDLPAIFFINDDQKKNFQGQRDIALYNTLLDFGNSLLFSNKVTKIDDYKNFFRHPSLPKDMPPFYESWSTDEEFGRQILNGVNPTTILRCTEVSDEFLNEEAHVFQNCTTFKNEIEGNRLFCINYRKYSKGIKRNCNKSGNILYSADPVALFRVNETGKLLPIAIQLEDGGSVFTPNDTEHDWLLAKLYFRNTDVNIHEWKYHFLRTHAIMEPFAIAMFRSFSKRHPVYKLLRPHLQTVPAINTLARENLIGPTAAANLSLSINGLEMARNAFETIEFEDLIIPKVFEVQGTDDVNILPFYHYRDDALLLWRAIQNYLSSVLQLYYKNDEDVTEDYELMDFVRSVAIDGIAWAGFGLKGFPVQLKTYNELVQYVTIIVFTCSVQHAASNFGQFEIYKFVPNAPAGMRLPPHKKGEGSLQRILDTLPDNIMSVLQLGTAFTLSTFAPNEIYLGDFPMKLFMDEEVNEQQKRFQEELVEISNKIKERNKNLKIPYVYLLPESIPNSIAV